MAVTGQGSGARATAQRTDLWAIAISLVAAATAMWATRRSPALSPDSITYLSTAVHLRGGDGIVDFSGDPMAVFGPLYPLLLAPGGDALWWARLVNAIALAGLAWAMYALLRRRVEPPLAVIAAALLVFSSLLVRITASVWTETPYMTIAVATLVLATRSRPSVRWAALVGVAAGAGFLVRYAGVGLVATAVVAVVLSSMPIVQQGKRGEVLIRAGACAGAAIGTAGTWVARNLIVTGEPLGPRFEGGTGESFTELLQLALAAIGRGVVGDSRADSSARTWGAVVVAAILAFLVVAIVRLAIREPHDRWRSSLITDVTVGLFGVVSVFLPILTRSISANDIEHRVMAPVLIAAVYVAVVSVSYIPANPALFTLAGVAVVLWVGTGLNAAQDFPDRAEASIINRNEASAAALHDAVDALREEAVVLTNSPQRVWWHNDRDPVSFAFTRPRPGNSHYPLDADHTLAAACTGEAVLVWFSELLNAGEGPEERRPDLLEVVRLERVATVEGGWIDRVVPIDPATCPP
jgi:4-amino-4-deoxy-L-arabinose transferase-like glycosyltransferase